MSSEERNAWASLIASLFAWGIIGTQILSDLFAGAFDGEGGLVLWANDMVRLILWGIGAVIVFNIILAILHAALRGDEAHAAFVDERDRMIALLSNRIVLACVSAGIIGAIIALSQGVAAPWALTAILLSSALGDTVGVIYKVWRYRRGF